MFAVKLLFGLSLVAAMVVVDQSSAVTVLDGIGVVAEPIAPECDGFDGEFSSGDSGSLASMLMARSRAGVRRGRFACASRRRSGPWPRWRPRARNGHGHQFLNGLSHGLCNLEFEGLLDAAVGGRGEWPGARGFRASMRDMSLERLLVSLTSALLGNLQALDDLSVLPAHSASSATDAKQTSSAAESTRSVLSLCALARAARPVIDCSRSKRLGPVPVSPIAPDRTVIENHGVTLARRSL